MMIEKYETNEPESYLPNVDFEARHDLSISEAMLVILGVLAVTVALSVVLGVAVILLLR